MTTDTESTQSSLGASYGVRLTKVETEIESLAMSMDKLGRTVEKSNEQTNIQLGNLALAVNSANGPRKTDWHLIITACIFLLAVCGAALSPIWMQVGMNQRSTEKLESVIEKNVTALDTKLQKETGLAAESIKERALSQQRQMDELDTRLQHEFRAAMDSTRDMTQALQTQIDRRVGALDAAFDVSVNRDLDELKERRLMDDCKSRKAQNP